MSDEAAEPLLIAFDGPAGSGKGTIARRVAEALGVPYFDTGAMYRAVALAVLDRGCDPDDREAVLEILDRVDVGLERREAVFEVLLDGEPVEDRIRTPQVGEATSKIATYPEVRQAMVALQRAYGRRHGGVMEGRDIGTRVFPYAPVKIYLDASPEVRAGRRWRQLRDAGRPVSHEEALEDVHRRDRRDSTREHSPLTCDDSYTRIDTSDLDVDQVVRRVLEVVASRAAESVRRDGG